MMPTTSAVRSVRFSRGRVRGTVSVGAALLLAAAGLLWSGRADALEVKVLLDLDGSASTGCNVVTPGGTFAGADQVLIATVDAGSNTVTALQRQVCSGGTLGAPIDVVGPFLPPWPIGPGNGASGSTLIESYFPLSLAPFVAPTVPVGFVLSDAGGDEDALLPASAVPTDGAATRIPTLSTWGVLLLSALILLAGFALLRRRGAVAALGVVLLLTGFAGVAWAAIVLDGQASDWAGIDPLATKPPSANPTHPELLSVYGVAQGGNLFFRVDATLASAPGITSADHAAFTVGQFGTFTVTTTGVPAPALTESGALPSPVTFTDNGDGTATISGTPAAGTGGTYPITITAANGISPDATQSFTLTVDQAPAITSADHATFTAGAAASFTVTTTGFPTGAAMVIGETGSLPVGFTDNHDGTATIAGTPAAGTGGTYPITITANNGVAPSATQSFTLTVDQAPAITSADHATFAVGAAGSFTVTTTGFPTNASMVIGETGSLPVSFTDNHDGTATIAGTPAAGAGGTYPITITANNGVAPSASQPFTLTVNQAPAITSADHATFAVGAAGSFTVTTTGFPTNATMLISESGSLPVSFTDNHDGTATIAGTPAAGAGGTYPITITASNGVAPNATQAFTLTVNQAPAITSADRATFTVGAAGSFTVTTTGVPTGASMAIGEIGALPVGVTFTDNHDGTALLAGTPAAGTGGIYAITITANNGVAPTATQPFTLTVDQAPAITSANSTTFTVGQVGTFTVTTTGFPTVASMAISEGGSLPVGFTDNHDGTATISGTPGAGTGGTYPITITANNGVAPNATQSFTLTVDQAPAITSLDHATFAVGVAGSFTVTTTGFPTNAAMVISESGSLPVGFTDNHDGTATIAGTPATIAAVGSYPITITANNGVAPNATQSFTLTVVCGSLTVSPSSLATGLVGVPYGPVGFSVTGASGTVTWGAGASLAGTGLTFTDNGDGTATLHGTPTASGSFTVTFTATDPNGCQGSQTITFSICPAISVAPTSLPTGEANTPYAGVTFTETGSSATPITWSLSGTLPAGTMSLDPSTGALAGTPSESGAFPITVTATDANGCAGSRSYVLTIGCAATTITVGPLSLPQATVSQVYGPQTLTVTGGTGPWVLTESGALPGTVQFTDNGNGTATLGGTPDHTGVFPITVAATDAGGCAGSQDYLLVVTCSGVSITVDPASLQVAPANETFSQTFTVSGGGTAPYSFGEAGQLPTGLTFTDNGDNTATLAGTPTQTGTFPITVGVTDHNGCTGSRDYTLTVDARPAVTSTTPADGATSVLDTTTVTINFSKAVNVTASAFKLECPAGTPVAFATSPTPPGGASSFVLTPSAPLPDGTACTATAVAAQVTDVSAGLSMAADHVFSFTTDTPPTVSTTTPANGATAVLATTTVTINFSKAVNVTASSYRLECPSGTPEAFAIAPPPPGGVASFALTPTSSLPAGAVCTATVVAAQTADLAGTKMASDFTWSFTVDTPPTVTSTVPTNGATGVSPASTVSVNFNKAVNVTASAFRLECPSGTPEAFAIAPAPPGGAAGFTLTPGSSLPADTACTATVVAAQVADLAGTKMTSDFVWSFATPPVASNDTYPQTVIGNVSVNSAAIPYSVTTNDVANSPYTITAFDATSANGGAVSVTTSGAGMGQFAYNPPAGFTGTDTFTYTIGNAHGSSTGTVSLSVAGMIWFINNAAGAGDGRLSSPFNSLATFQGVNDGAGLHPAAGQSIFLYDSASAYTGPVTLLNGQRLIGQDASSSLATIAAVSPGSGSAALPATGGSAGGTKITSAGAGVALGQNNQVDGLTLSGTTGTALGSAANVGTFSMADVNVNNTTGPGMSFTGGGTITGTGVNTIATTTATALNVVSTGIAAANLTFRSISANGAANGIVLNNTGASGGLVVAGNGGTCTSTGSTCTGGTIQSTTGHAISLTSTRGPSFSYMKITNIAKSGIFGTSVTNFTLANSVIDGVNTSHDTTDGNVAFNLNGGGSTENNLSGAVSITNSFLNNSWQNGIAIVNFAGAISSLTITGNSLTSVATFQAGSAGTAIQVLAEQGSSVAAQITAGTISSNAINNFPGGGGIVVHGGSTANLPAVAIGSSGSPILIEANTITGAGTGLAGIGTNGIEVTIGHNSTGYFTIGASGLGNTITNVAGDGVACSLFGTGTEKCTIAFNTINAHNTAGSPGINTGADSATSNTNTGTLYLDIHDNIVSNTTGNGILATVRNVDSTGIFHIENNNVSAPTTTANAIYGIRVDAGNGTESAGATVCLKIDGNITAGNTNLSGSIIAPGIGLRQQHATVTSTFNIDGLTPNPSNDAQMEAYVGNAGQNPGSANGNFGATGVASISSGATFHAATCTIP